MSEAKAQKIEPHAVKANIGGGKTAVFVLNLIGLIKKKPIVFFVILGGVVLILFAIGSISKQGRYSYELL